LIAIRSIKIPPIPFGAQKMDGGSLIMLQGSQKKNVIALNFPAKVSGFFACM
jgi:hypothetical protein